MKNPLPKTNWRRGFFVGSLSVVRTTDKAPTGAQTAGYLTTNYRQLKFTDWQGKRTIYGGNAISTNGVLYQGVMETIRES